MITCPTCGTENESGRKFCGECGTKLAAVCPSCGTANAATARFCGECGTPLAGAPSPASSAGAAPATRPAAAPATAPAVGVGTTPVAERRLVSILFADLVGFTTISEGRDHEEVRELLSRYFESSREIIERYGGTVEKFIGDAVMAVWGAPTAHEDDAERAVRAGLDVVEAVKDLGPGLQARAGVLTGEAAVTLGATGQGMVAGDLVNTASRLQSVAPAGVVLVGESTHRATSNAIAYESAGEQLLKGKATPVPAFRALRVVGRRGGAGRADRLEAPFVGRDSELRLLKDLFHTTSRERRVRLVSITGQAGVGKSRLVWELRKYGDGLLENYFWHEGRSPAYGQGITFWALGEMVRGRCGLVETDDQFTTRSKVTAAVARFIPEGPDRERVERALLALLGVGEAPEGGAGELFGAWRLFFESMAATQLVTLIFEDLHWADPGTLDFIDHLLDWTRNVPILIVTLARPELLDHRPEWGAGRRNFLALDLEPLDSTAMRGLLDGFVQGLPEPAARSIVRRAEGIPLYAVETIRMLVADSRLRPIEGGRFEPAGALGELAIPDTLHALIAARLDGLDPAERALIQDAAVLGQSFTKAGLTAVSGLAPAELDARLRVLVRSDLLHEDVDPRSPERGQYAFVQALMREVAYSTLAMKERRSRHLAAARFFESLGDEELAGALASHYVSAFRASPAGPEADALASQARVSLRGAADRAQALGSPIQAVTFLEQAVEVASDDLERATLLERAALASAMAAKAELGLALVDRAWEIRERLGDRGAMAGNVAARVRVLRALRQRETALDVTEAALAEYAELGQEHPAIIDLNLAVARIGTGVGKHDLAMEAADRVAIVGERLALSNIVAEALTVKGICYFYGGRLWEARAVLEGARIIARNFNLADVELRVIHNLGLGLALDDARAAVELERDGLALARRLGERSSEVTLLGNVVEDARRTGEWAWALGELDAAIALDIDAASRRSLVLNRAAYHAYTGTISDADRAEIDRPVLDMEDADVDAAAFEVKASISLADGDWLGVYRNYLQMADTSPLNAPYVLPIMGWAAILGRDAGLARAAIDRLRQMGTRGRATDAGVTAVKAGISALEGDPAAAMAGFRQAIAAARELGIRLDEALIAMVAVSCLGADEPETLGWATQAADFFDEVGALPLGEQLARLIDQTSASDIQAARAAMAGAPAEPPSSGGAGAAADTSRTSEAPATG
ncbi:MAG TPA: adenylate/guanylate cyclase domain-containing protein [Candidatus Limnocylindrales bacterium]|nr:adenylate/guanylate cyclase domain-containing protein [Candidatus Limnocylindrales bacterium]